MRYKFIFLLSAVFALGLCDFTPTRLSGIEEAQKLLLQQRYPEAIVKYENLLKKTLPKDIKVKIYYQLGELYSIYLSENKKAVEYYEKIQNNTEDLLLIVKAHERIADINFLFLKEYNTSFQYYDELMKFVPKLKRYDFYQYRRALSALKIGKLEIATDMFNEILKNKKHEYYVSSMYNIGLIKFRKQEWGNAIENWREYIKYEKSSDQIVQTKFLMANAYETMEELKQAYNIYRSIRGKYPNSEVIERKLRSIYERRVARKRD